MSATSVTDVTAFALPAHLDARGRLMPLDFSELPFRPERVFAVTGVPGGTRRGGHGHREQHHFMTCLSGSIRVELRAPRADVATVTLRPGDGLLVEPGVWAAQTYEEPDSVLMVLASGPYEPAELFHEPPDA